ncbi:unnamed protein product [Gadus morhua 'NCC']
MAPHHCRICSAAMSADDEHRECPDCLGAVQRLEDIDNHCSAAVDLSRGERLRRANQVRGHAQEGRAERRCSPRRSPRTLPRRTQQVELAAVVNHVRTLEVGLQEDYTRMLTSSWGRAFKRPQFNAGCRNLAMTVYPAETGLGEMPPVEASIASWTSLGPARVSSNPSCPCKECAKKDRLVTRSFNASARAARTGNALASTLAALRRTLDPADGDAMGLVEAALSPFLGVKVTPWPRCGAAFPSGWDARLQLSAEDLGVWWSGTTSFGAPTRFCCRGALERRSGTPSSAALRRLAF